jgi:divalent metal cation (Fe/Co/Zn/Cd) transporter
MMESVTIPNPETASAIRRIQWLTVGWMTIEVGIALVAALRAHSVVLAAFGGDSVIELLSAAVVLARFHSTSRVTEKSAGKITGWLLIALGAYITVQSLYVLGIAESKPEPSYPGIGLLLVAALVMPWLARRKRQLGITTNSVALRADAAQSSICGYLSWVALAGLLLNALAHASWADPVAALGLLPIIIKEAKESLQACSCECNGAWVSASKDSSQ